MLKGFAQEGNIVKWQYWYEKMLQSRVIPDAQTLDTVLFGKINAWGGTSETEEQRRMEKWLPQAQAWQEKYTSVLGSMGKNNRITPSRIK
mmetsp:Transcript_267/g.407  ORF Transcript_267/g.407 Transcript_267/m.407 type:complete len:90 (+) Transcript_267:777-1046(+)